MENRLWEALVCIREGVMIKGSRSDMMHKNHHCALGFLEAAGVTMVDSSREAATVVSVARELFPGRDDPQTDPFNGPYGVAHLGTDLEPAARLAAFNNHPDTTQDDLEIAFEKAAIRLDELV